MKCVKIYNYEWAAHGYLGWASLEEIIQFLCHHLKCVHSSSTAKRNGNRQAGELLWKHLLGSSLVCYNAIKIPLGTVPHRVLNPQEERREKTGFMVNMWHGFLVSKQKTKTIITHFACYQHVPTYHNHKKVALRCSKVTIDQQSIKCFWVTAIAGTHSKLLQCSGHIQAFLVSPPSKQTGSINY